MTSPFEQTPPELFAIITENIDDHQTLLSLSQTCRHFRNSLDSLSMNLGEKAFVRIGRSKYPFFDKALMYGRIQNIPVDSLPKFDLCTKAYVNAPTKDWFGHVTRKAQIGEVEGPSITYMDWREELRSLFQNFTRALNWTPIPDVKRSMRWHIRPQDEELLQELGEHSRFWMMVFFSDLTFTRLFGPETIPREIAEGSNMARSGMDFEPDLQMLLYEQIRCATSQYSPNKYDKISEVTREEFQGFFNWLCDEMTPSTAREELFMLLNSQCSRL